MQESEKWKGSRSVMSDSSRPHGLQPTRLLRPWDLPGKSTGVGCHRLLQEKLWAAFKSKSDFSVSKLHCISCHDSNIYNNDNAQCWKDWLSGLLIHYCPACFQTPHCPSLALCHRKLCFPSSFVLWLQGKFAQWTILAEDWRARKWKSPKYLSLSLFLFSTAYLPWVHLFPNHTFLDDPSY